MPVDTLRAFYNSHGKAVSTFRPLAGSPRPEPEPTDQTHLCASWVTPLCTGTPTHLGGWLQSEIHERPASLQPLSTQMISAAITQHLPSHRSANPTSMSDGTTSPALCAQTLPHRPAEHDVPRSEVSAARVARESDSIADIGGARHIAHEPLEAQTVARVRYGAVAT